MKRKFTFLTAAFMLLAFLAVPLGMRGQTTTIDFEDNAIPTGWTNTNDMAVVSNPVSNTSSTNGSYCLSTNGKTSNSLTSGLISNVVSISVDACRTSNNTTNEVYIDFCPNTNFGSTDTQTQSVTVNKNSWSTSTLTLSSTASGYVRIRRSGGSSTATKFIDNIVITCSSGGGTQTVATPQISPNAGAVPMPQQITITCSTQNANIYYTTNDDEPTTSSTPYEGPFNITGACTVKAIAAKEGMENSTVAFATYTQAQVATPTFNLAAGTYYGTQQVTINCATEGASITYSLDGSQPSTNYDGPVTISESCTLKAVATKTGYSASTVAEAAYVIEAGFETIFSQDWEGDMNSWAFVSVTGDEVWSVSSYSNNKFAKMSGYNSGNKANEDWIISPSFNLNDYTNATLSFTSARSSHNGEVIKVFFTNNYTDNPSTTNWNELSCTLPEKPSNGYSSFVSSGEISLNSYTGTSCRIGIKYTSTTSEATTWEVDDIILVGQESTNPVITVNATDITVPSYVVGTTDPEYETLTINGSHLTGNISLTLNANSDFEMSTDLTTWSNFLTLDQTSGSVTNEQVAVRMKAGLAKGNHSGTITLTSTGVTEVMVNLTGTVTGQTYTIEQYTSPTTAHGTIIFAPASPVEDGTEVTLTATPAEGYDFTADSWVFYNASTLEQVALTVTDGNKITMPAYNLAVDATFSAKTTYDITTAVDPANSGTIATDANAWEGKEVTVLVEAAANFAFTGIVVCKTDDPTVIVATTGNYTDGFTFMMPAYEVTVTASFETNYNVTYDFTTVNNFYTEAGGSTHPGTGSSNNIGEFYYGNGDKFTAEGTNYYFSGGYFLLGKSGALLNLPTFNDYKITQIILHSSTGHSTKVNVAIVDDEGHSVAAEQNWGAQDSDYTYSIPVQYQTSALSVKVTNGNNTQFTSITLVRELASAPALAVEPSSVNLPSFNAVNGTLNVAADNFQLTDVTASEIEYYEYDNVNDEFVAANKPGWITVTCNSPYSTVNYSIAENDGEARATYFKLHLTYGTNEIRSGMVTITQAKFVIDYATLPFVFVGNEDETPTGVTTTAGTYSASPYLKFDGTGKYLTLKLNQAPTSLSYDIKGNSFSGGTFKVQTSDDGVTYTDLATYTDLGETQSITHLDLHSSVRFIKWIYTNKDSGNVGLGNIHASANYDIYGDVTVTELTIPADKVCTIYSPATLNVTTSLTNEATSEAWNHLVIKDGAQLKTPNEVNGTVEKVVAGYGSSEKDKYVLLATPATMDACNHTGMWNTADQTQHANVDLYAFDQKFNGEEWRNYKYGNTYFAGPIAITQGTGYLYANKEDVTLTLETRGYVAPNTSHQPHPFSATDADIDVAVSYSNDKPFAGWNLIGNPFTCKAYLADGSDFYRMNADGNGLIINTDAQGGGNAINVCEGIFVETTASKTSVTFTTTDPTVTSTGNNNGMVNISVAQVVNSRDAQPSADYARIRVNNGKDMTKFVFNENTSRVYIPQGNKDYAVVRSEARGEMPVNFKAAENGTYTIDVEAENLEVNYLHLIDNLTGMDVDLLATPSYTFEARKSDIASRFRLVFDANTGNDETNDNFAFINNGELIVNGNGTVQVIDILGRQMFSHEVNSAFRIQNSEFAPGVYVLRLVNGNDVKTQKIVIK